MGKDSKKGPGGCKPKLPAHLKRVVDTIGILPHEWEQLKEIGPSKGKAVSKLLLWFKNSGKSRKDRV